MQIDESTCVNCGAVLKGKYCSECGNKKTSPDDFKFSIFIEHTVDVFTHFDSKFFKSLKLLLLKPGLLTVNYLNGKRVPYMKPLQLFIVMNVIFYFAFSFTPIAFLNSPLQMQLKYQPYSRIALKMYQDKVTAYGINEKEYEAKYNEKTNAYSKTLPVILIPMFASLFWLLHIKSKRYFSEHLVAASHFTAFVLAFEILFLIPIFITYLLKIQITEFYISASLVLIFAIYISLAFRRIYNDSKIGSILKSIVVGLAFFFLIFIYRFVLFILTIYTT